MTTDEAVAILEDAGAEKERREDEHGKTRSGWWLGGVWLAPTNKPVDAVKAIRGT